MRECVCVCVCARVCESSGIISLSKEDQEISAVELWGGCDQFSGDRAVTGHYYSCQSIGSDQQGVKENTKQNWTKYLKTFLWASQTNLKQLWAN